MRNRRERGGAGGDGGGRAETRKTRTRRIYDEGEEEEGLVEPIAGLFYNMALFFCQMRLTSGQFNEAI